MNFVILATRRTGSSYLTGLLRRRPDIFCHGEIFNGRRIQAKRAQPRWRIENEDELLALRAADPEQFLRRMATSNFGKPVVGFKMMAGQNPDMLARVLDDPSIRKIVLSRENLLARYASDEAAHESGDFSGTGEKPPVRFDPAAFERSMRISRRFYKRIDDALSGRERFAMRFDQINDGEIIAALLRFIGAQPDALAPAAPPPNRASADVLSRFSNPGDVQAYLESNGLTHWRHEHEREPT